MEEVLKNEDGIRIIKKEDDCLYVVNDDGSEEKLADRIRRNIISGTVNEIYGMYYDMYKKIVEICDCINNIGLNQIEMDKEIQQLKDVKKIDSRPSL